eukprot:1798681-Amphidinium_carterae.1
MVSGNDDDANFGEQSMLSTAGIQKKETTASDHRLESLTQIGRGHRLIRYKALGESIGNANQLVA